MTTNTDAALRAAFTTANGLAGPQTICIDSGLGTITLGGTELAYTAATTPGLTVQGNGTTISGNNASRVISNLTAGPLTLNDVTITGGNAGGAGGGAFSVGSLTVTNSTISGNTAQSGGGVSSDGSVATLTNSTISGNHSTSDGGGVFSDGSGPGVTLVYSGPNSANVSAATGLTSFGSVVAQPKGGGANCAAASTTSNGFNFSDDASVGVSCHFNAATDRVGASNDPMPGAPANNGSPTQTRLPLSGSPLIDAIPLASCQADGASGITTDQRGFARPSPPGGACDIGAVEVPPAPAPTAVVITPKFTG